MVKIYICWPVLKTILNIPIVFEEIIKINMKKYAGISFKKQKMVTNTSEIQILLDWQTHDIVRDRNSKSSNHNVKSIDIFFSTNLKLHIRIVIWTQLSHEWFLYLFLFFMRNELFINSVNMNRTQLKMFSTKLFHSFYFYSNWCFYHCSYKLD